MRIPNKKNGLDFFVESPVKESFQFLEFGKYKNTSEGRASDFAELTYSYGLKEFSPDLRKALAFPSDSSFTEIRGNISFALIYFGQVAGQSRYLFVQLQSRREGEFSDKPPTNRPFMQERYTLIEEKTLRKILEGGYEPYDPLIIRSIQQGNTNSTGLKMYQDDELGIGEYWVTYEPEKPLEKLRTPYLQQYLAGAKGFRNLDLWLQNIVTIADAVVQSKHVQVNSSNLEVEEQFLLVQAVQRLVFPSIGVMTFAFDHVTSQTVRLQFYKNLPIPSRVQPVVIELSAKQTGHDVSQNSYSKHMLQFMQDLKTTLLSVTSDFQQVWTNVNQALLAEEFILAFQKGGKAVNAIDAYWLHNYAKRLNNLITRFKRSHQFISNESFRRVLDAFEQTELIALLDKPDLQMRILQILRSRLPLPQFAEILLDKETTLLKPVLLEQLKLSAQESASSVVKQCSDKTLNFLLDLRESSPISFADEKELLFVFTEVTDQHLDDLLVQRLKNGNLVKPILEALTQAKREDLLTFFVNKVQLHEVKNYLLHIPLIIQHSNSASLRQADENTLKILIAAYEQNPLQFQDGIDLLDAYATQKTEVFDRILSDCLKSKRLVEPILKAIEQAGRSDLINFYVHVPDISPDLLKRILRRLIQPEQKKSLITNNRKLRQILEPYVKQTKAGIILPPLGLEAKDEGQFGQICLEISLNSPRFAQWFLYNSWLDLDKDDEGVADTYFETIIFELPSRMRMNVQLRDEFGQTSSEFQSLVKKYENDTK